MRLFRNTITVLATSAASMPLYFVTSIILARFLSVEDRGIYGVVIATVATTALISEMGWGPATIFRIRRVGSNPGSVATAAIVATLLISIVVLALGLVFQDWFRARFMDNAPPWVLYAALAAVPFQLLWLSFASMARGIDRFAMQNGFQLALHVGRLVGMALVLIVLGGALREALGVYVAMLGLITLGLVIGVVRATGLTRLDLNELTQAWAFGLRSYAGRLAAQLHERVDIFMIAYMLGDPSQVAYYSVGVALLGQLKVIPDSAAQALYPQLAGTAGEHTGALAARVSRHTMLFVTVSVLLVAPVAPFIIPLVYGEAYTQTVLPFMILLPGMALFTRFRVLSNYFVSLGQLRILIAIQVASVIVNVGLNLWLIPRWGPSGAALASTLSHSLAAIWITFTFMDQAGVGFRETLIFRASDLEPYRRRYEKLRRRQSGSDGP